MRKKFTRSLESLESVYEFTESVLETGQVAEPVKFPVHLAMEELFVNMVKYNPETTSDIELAIDTSHGGVTVTLTEHGVDPFDVTRPRGVNIEAPLAERKPGGLGLHLIQNMVDRLEYEYDEGRSRVIFTKEPGKADV